MPALNYSLASNKILVTALKKAINIYTSYSISVKKCLYVLYFISFSSGPDYCKVQTTVGSDFQNSSALHKIKKNSNIFYNVYSIGIYKMDKNT